MKAIKSGKVNSSTDDAYDVGIGTQFSVETNTRDEDAEMYDNCVIKPLSSNWPIYVQQDEIHWRTAGTKKRSCQGGRWQE